MSTEKITFCKGGGCTAKLGAQALNRVLSLLPKGERDPDLLVGYASCDDAAVYRLTDEIAFVQTLDFFPPMVPDPYLFGQIAAANALSDIYAMGGEVKTALNIVCFPEKWDLNILGEILRGGAEKVAEAGASLAGGHSIADSDVKYGLSVTGVVHPDHIWANNTGQPGDVLILTKALGVGIICTADRVDQAPEGSLEAAVRSMTTLNRYAAECCAHYDIHACTDVTGFGMLGHMLEMAAGSGVQICVDLQAAQAQVIPEAWKFAEMGILPAGMYRNRHFAQEQVEDCSLRDQRAALWSQELQKPVHGQDQRVTLWSQTMQDLLYDPQTSGGLLMAADPEDAPQLLADLQEAEKQPGNEGMQCAVIGYVQAYEGGKRIQLI